MRAPGLSGLLFALAAASFYGINIVSTRLAAFEGISGVTLVFYRVVLMLILVLGVAALWRASLRVASGERGTIAVLGVATAALGAAYLSSVAFIPVTVAVVIFYTYPVLIVLASPIIDGARITGALLLVVTLAVAGVVLVVGPVFHGLDWRGLALAGTASLATAVQFFAATRCRATSVMAKTFWIHVIVLPASAIIALAAGALAPPDLLLAAPIAVAVTIGGYVLGFVFQFAALARSSAMVAGIAFCAEPVVAALSSAVMLGERLSAVQLLGGALVLAAIMANVMAEQRRARAGTASRLAMTDPPRGPLPPIPLTVFTGFLGAGKTTLLNHLLRDPALADTVVIVNEFGEIGLDHLLVETVEDGMILLSAGCLCCTVRGDLIATLEDLLRRRDNGRVTPFRRVVIETTGLADPAPILHAVLYHPYLSMRYALEGVVTVVDAVNGAATLDAYEEAVRQAAVADRIVIAKADLLPEGSDLLAALQSRLRALSPGAEILVADRGAVPAERLVDAGLFDTAGKIADVRDWLKAEAVEAAEQRSHEAAHGHDHHRGHHHHHHDVNRHDASIRAFALSSDAPVSRGAFDMFLDLLRSAHGPKLLRVKGLVALADDPEHPVVIHGVQHVFHVPAILPGWPDADRRSRLVFIVKDLDKSFVERLWNAFLGRPAVDTPDAAALVDNPLALHGPG